MALELGQIDDFQPQTVLDEKPAKDSEVRACGTKGEAYVLSDINRCQRIADLQSLRVHLFEKNDVESGVDYLSTAIHHTILLWEHERNFASNLESWWRIFLYGPAFEMAFALTDDYSVVRSEFTSLAYKDYNVVFKDIVIPTSKKTDKVDLAIRSNDNQADVFTREDKPLIVTTKAVEEAAEKNKNRRCVTLDAIELKLPHAELIDAFDTMTALWHGSKLTIHATRKIKSKYYHYVAGTAAFPLSPTNFCAFAKLLLLTLSLKRCVIKNHKYMKAIEECKSSLSIEQGSRSPPQILRQDDSVEYDADDLDLLINGAEKEEIDKYRSAIANSGWGDEKIITPAELAEIYNATQPVNDTDKKLNSSMVEREKDIVTYVDVPGVKEEDIRVITRPPNTIHISATRHQPSVSTSTCDITFPKQVQIKLSKRSMELGMLMITTPKEHDVEYRQHQPISDLNIIITLSTIGGIIGGGFSTIDLSKLAALQPSYRRSFRRHCGNRRPSLLTHVH
ncbi:hypothetical protein BJV82DRAFT_670035 [Fennellomyces sp. T-0311]|nr:hypothetical protein BJV82DRAFT_670035 [Fennellomyces sp. T-0311]